MPPIADTVESEPGAPLAELDASLAALQAATSQWSVGDRERLHSAVLFGIERHEGQRRRSGEPYITHPLRVAAIVAALNADVDTVIGAVLHDTVEDTNATLEDIRQRFGAPVAGLVDGATKLAAVRGDDPDQLEAARLRKLFVALAADPRVVVIKLADRLHNLRTIAPLPPNKQARIARETLAIHGPLAHRLGLAGIKTELEDRAFAIAHPEEFQRTTQVLADMPELAAALEAARTTLVAHLAAVGINAEVQARIKHAWSVYRKERAGYDLASLHDLLGLRIIVGTVTECYAALGEVHALWEPVPGRIKDYISRPKFNAYRSIHTTVHIGGRLLEIQVRTQEMHRQAEWGDAAHHAYKTRGPVQSGAAKTGPAQMGDRLGTGEPAEPQWLQRLLDWHDTADDGDYLRQVTSELGSGEVWVLTPTGEVLTLPTGAGVIDFAYAIHSEVGHRCSGAKVNGKLVPLATKLRSGDRVEIMTARTTGPSLDWLAYAATGRAKGRIRQWHGRLRRQATRRSGEAALAQLLARHHSTADKVGPVLLAAAGAGSWDSLADQVGSSRVELSRLDRALRLHLHGRTMPDGTEDESGGPRTKPAPVPATPSTDAVVVAPGLEGVEVALAGCCLPVATAPVIGVSSRLRGVVAHRSTCDEALATIAQNPGRQVRMVWVAPGVRVSSVHVVCRNTPGAMAQVVVALHELGADIESSSSSIAEDGQGVQYYEISHRCTRATVRAALRNLAGVHSVTVS
ncbi:MAG: RelA/SpoT family protein [Acidimicrobiales bacterium]